MQTIAEALRKLQSSKFRSSFHLSESDIDYVDKKGMSVIRSHAEDFIRLRLSPAVIPNDGRQTPMRGHPVFVAQHACACCFAAAAFTNGTELSRSAHSRTASSSGS